MIAWIGKRGLTFGVFPALEAVAPSLRVFFTTREGGVSRPPRGSLNLGDHVGDVRAHVRENRRRLKLALGLGRSGIARGGQVHGAEIAVASRGGRMEGTDGFITTKRGLVLAVNSADCFPLILHSPSEMVLTALHVGRSGAAAGIIEKAFEMLFERYAIDPENTIAVCGPGICRGCYEVSERIARKFPGHSVITGSGRPHLDLRRFIRDEVSRAGVRPANWFDTKLCTSCESGLFFSHRRDGGVTGRHWTLAFLR